MSKNPIYKARYTYSAPKQSIFDYGGSEVTRELFRSPPINFSVSGGSKASLLNNKG